MESLFMNLKILLPYKVFADKKKVSRIVMQTYEGSFGILPQRLDCVAALAPGIFTYEIESGQVQYLALEEGVLVKTGLEVLVSVRNAIGGADLGKLRASVEKDFKQISEKEKMVKAAMVKLESSFIYNLEKFRKK
ncbi:MAG TPA: F0F1 ATP synthase subunit epsilon [Hanamia sp.]|nr:F0F1 ATP synthase subunit epsilon [Hanamia sp.]